MADIGLGTLFAGNAALLQISVLPGLVAHEWQVRRHGHMPALDSLLFVFAFSAVAGFLLVLLLQVCGLQSRIAWQLLGWLQIAVALSLHVTNRQQRQIIRVDNPRLPLAGIMGLLIYLFCLIEMLRTLLGHWPGVLQGWDSIVSWNRWAQDWNLGHWPSLTWGYPQLIPAAWSVIYQWQGSNEIEVFIRIWMGLFPVALMLVFLAMYVHWRRWTLLLAGALVSGLLLGPYRQVLDSGYVDVPLSFAILLTAHWTLLAVHDQSRAGHWLIYATVSTALALLIKQGGLLALVMWLWAIWGLRSRQQLVLQAAGLLLLLILPWYGLVLLHGQDASVTDYVTREIYGDEQMSARLVRALTQTLPAVTGIGANSRLAAVSLFIGIIGFVLALRDRSGRFCMVMGLGALLVWAANFSYDGRNLLPAIPLMLLAVAHGYGRMQLTPTWSYELLTVNALRSYRPIYQALPILAVLVLAGSWLPANVARWEHLTNNLRKASGDPSLNRQLLAYVSRPDFNGLIYTTYPYLAAISELRPHWFNDFGASHMQPATAAALRSGTPLCAVLATMARHQSIAYLLLNDSVYPAMVNTALAQGSLQMVLSVPGVKFMRVLCPATGTQP